MIGTIVCTSSMERRLRVRWICEHRPYYIRITPPSAPPTTPSTIWLRRPTPASKTTSSEDLPRPTSGRTPIYPPGRSTTAQAQGATAPAARAPGSPPPPQNTPKPPQPSANVTGPGREDPPPAARSSPYPHPAHPRSTKTASTPGASGASACGISKPPAVPRHWLVHDAAPRRRSEPFSRHQGQRTGRQSGVCDETPAPMCLRSFPMGLPHAVQFVTGSLLHMPGPVPADGGQNEPLCERRRGGLNSPGVPLQDLGPSAARTPPRPT